VVLSEARCTSCGANLKVDPTKDAAVCEFCGAAFVVEKAINNYNIENAQINAQTINLNVGGGEFIIEGGVLRKYKGNDSDVTIPYNVKRIEKLAFFDSYIESVTIPQSVIEITTDAFNNCKLLSKILVQGTPTFDSNCIVNCPNISFFPIPNGSKIAYELTNEYKTEKKTENLNESNLWRLFISSPHFQFFATKSEVDNAKINNTAPQLAYKSFDEYAKEHSDDDNTHLGKGCLFSAILFIASLAYLIKSSFNKPVDVTGVLVGTLLMLFVSWIPAVIGGLTKKKKK